jgi:hypothetical protein
MLLDMLIIFLLCLKLLKFMDLQCCVRLFSNFRVELLNREINFWVVRKYIRIMLINFQMGTGFIYILSSLHLVISCTAHKIVKLLNLVSFISVLKYNKS